jgi:acyl-CoA thioesterase-1
MAKNWLPSVRSLFLLACPVAAALSPQAASAQTIGIVAIGASNTAGAHVATSEAWPAQLEAMLRAKGYAVRMSVEGVIGDTSAGILRRIDSAVPAGTSVVLYDTGGGNDADAGTGSGQIAANKAAIEQRIRAHRAKPILVAYPRIIGSEAANPSAYRQGDAHHHLTAQSHARVAASLLPQVVAAIGRKR